MSAPVTDEYEKLGAFYLGKSYDLENRQLRDDLLLYDSKDLTTHAVCVGMTGSGKTGLCLSLLEEAAIDGIPAIAIDPKGDLGNLMLTFPNLAAEDFRPWIDESAAARKGITPEQHAAATAQMWRDGLASWGQSPERIRLFREAVDLAIYTPGSSAGLPLTVLRSFAAPPPAVLEDSDALRERITSSTSGLLSLLGVDADPVRSREHILIANLFDRAWRAGRDLDVAALIGEIQAPPFDRVGIIDLETFFPSKDRTALAMSLNNLLASPSFASWMEGEPLDIKRLLYTAEGKPRLSILSIAHLNDSERMFFVTILLNEVLAWIRSQPGTTSLRALLYMDEVYGYFPPVANPPSKTPMLTLLKQARAYGLGIVLATQNPVDLDYKGLSNTGTWFLGRLQTERDKMRVLEGLEGASIQAGSTFDKARMEATLAGLGSRVFLMNNVHEDQPVVFQTRWALSYLRGPLTRMQIQQLMASRKQAATAASTAADAAADSPPMSQSSPPSEADAFAELLPAGAPRQTASAASAASTGASGPLIPSEVRQVYLPASAAAEGERIEYRPALLGGGRLHYVRVGYQVDEWQAVQLLAELGQPPAADPWQKSRRFDCDAKSLSRQPPAGAEHAAAAVELARLSSYRSWQKQLKDYLYRELPGVVWKCAELKQFSQLNEPEADFRIRIAQLARERRDEEIEALRDKYASQLRTLEGRLTAARQARDKQQAQYDRAKYDSVLSVGSSLIGALFGRKLMSRTNVSKATTGARSIGRAAEQRGDIAAAEEKIEAVEAQLKELEQRFEQDAQSLEARYHPEALNLEPLSLAPRKSDMQLQPLVVAWRPWRVAANGQAEPAWASHSVVPTFDEGSN